VFVVAGLAFKLGVVPFHMWIPDVYQGAPTAVTLMIGAAPKLAAFAITIRLLVDGLLPLAFDWQQMLAVLAICSLLVGNLAAIAQTNLKRMLAYSTISQMGFAGLVVWRGQRQCGCHSSRERLQRIHVLCGHLCADHTCGLWRYFVIGA
jgi:NADH-quinone oxidoreductase subunit N